MNDASRSFAAYVAQRTRIGEPDLIPERMSPDEFMKILSSAQTTGSEGARGEPEREDGVAAVDAHDHETLMKGAMECMRCRLSGKRTQVVFGTGNTNANLMVIGEAPGADEDATGVPFVGRAGQLLDLMLASVDLSREETVYICNVLKCRPPGNRDPMPDEIESCAPYLKRQIELVAPQVLLAAGAFAARWLTSSNKSLGELRGTVYEYQGVPVVVTYHPSALLRNVQWNRSAWEDLQLLRGILDRS